MNHIGRIVSQHWIKTIFSQALRPVKDAMPISNPGVCAAPCGDCQVIYIGETKRQIRKRLKEHQTVLSLGQPEKSALAKHGIKLGPRIFFEEAN